MEKHALFGIAAGRDLFDAIGRLAQTHPELAAKALRAVFSDGVKVEDGRRSGDRPVVSEERMSGQSRPGPVTLVKRPITTQDRERIPRKVYSAHGKGMPPAGDLTRSQVRVLMTLRESQERFTVDDLATSCELKRKSVENILSALRQRKLIETHDPR